MPLIYKTHYINDYKKMFITDNDINLAFDINTNRLELGFKDETKLSTFQKKMMNNKAAKNFLFSKTQNIYI